MAASMNKRREKSLGRKFSVGFVEITTKITSYKYTVRVSLEKLINITLQVQSPELPHVKNQSHQQVKRVYSTIGS